MVVRLWSEPGVQITFFLSLLVGVLLVCGGFGFECENESGRFWGEMCGDNGRIRCFECLKYSLTVNSITKFCRSTI